MMRTQHATIPPMIGPKGGFDSEVWELGLVGLELELKGGDDADAPNETNEVDITTEVVPGEDTEEVSDLGDVLDGDELSDTYGEDGRLDRLVDDTVPPVVEKRGTTSSVSNWNLSSINSEFLLESPRFVTTMV